MSLPVITLMGATASGKTRLAMALFHKDPDKYMLINVDSALIYRGMDIGTAKPTADELASYPHALVDIVDPAETYSVGQFRTDVDALIQQAHAQGKIPVLVGGTMMYYRSLLGELDPLPASTEASRNWITWLQQQYSPEYCHGLLEFIDPAAFIRLHPNDQQRVGRVLEIWFLTGKALSEISSNNSAIAKHQQPLQPEQKLKKINRKLFNTPQFNLAEYLLDLGQISATTALATSNAQGLYQYHDAKGKTLTSQYNLLQFAMYNQDRQALHQDIAKRLEQMKQQGLLAEVTKLYQRGDLHAELPSVRCVGYRQLWDYLDSNIDLATAYDQVLFATRQLAKRQITWLRSWPQPFTQIPTYLDVEYQIQIIEKVLELALAREQGTV